MTHKYHDEKFYFEKFSSRAVIVLSMQWWGVSMEGSSWASQSRPVGSREVDGKTDSKCIVINLQINNNIKKKQQGSLDGKVIKMLEGLTF